MKQPAPLGIDLLMALRAAIHAQCSVHVHIVARQVKADEQLEQHGPPGHRGGQKYQQAHRRASVRHHA